jgi:predicted ATPase
MYTRYGALKCGWVRAQLGDRNEGLAQMRQSLDSLRREGDTLVITFYLALLAEIEAEAGESEAAVATIDLTLAEIDRIGQRTFEAEAHRIRGEILLRREPANPASAEEAFQTAIAVAQKQGARSFGLRAALSLAKLYRLTGRPVYAHAVLAPALEGFSPTPAMVEIAEAQALLSRLP